MELTRIQREILRTYGHRYRSGKVELLSSQEVAEQLETTKDIINDELKKLKAMGLLDVQGAFGGNYSASITDEGLIVLDDIGPISDR